MYVWTAVVEPDTRHTTNSLPTFLILQQIFLALLECLLGLSIYRVMKWQAAKPYSSSILLVCFATLSHASFRVGIGVGFVFGGKAEVDRCGS